MNFYVWNHSATIGGPYEAIATKVSPKWDPAERCPLCGRFVSMRLWRPPYCVDIVLVGKELGDVVSREPVVSTRLVDAFEDHRLTGMEFAPVRVRRISKGDVGSIGPLFLARIRRGRAAISVIQSGLERGPVMCPECRSMLNVERASRVIVEDDTWDGLDVFVPRGLPVTLVSAKFVAMYVDSGLKGAIFTPSEDFQFDFAPWKKALS